MAKFSMEDFVGDNVTRLSVICMPKIGKKPLFPFKSLMEHEKKKFNKAMNEYIQSLGENWDESLRQDFDEVCNAEIFNEQFDPTTHFIRELNDDITPLDKLETKLFLDERA